NTTPTPGSTANGFVAYGSLTGSFGSLNLTGSSGYLASVVNDAANQELDVTFQALTSPTTTVVNSSSPNNTSTYGETVTFTATVSNDGGNGAPTGSVEFFDGSINLGAGIP